MSNPMEKAKGTVKEVAGKATGSDELAREGQAQQRTEMHREDAEASRREARAEEERARDEAAEQRAHQ